MMMHNSLLLACVSVLVLVLVGCAAPRDVGNWTEALGPEWTLVQLDGKAPIEGTKPTLTFAEDGRAVGHGGANRFFGTFTASPDGHLTLSALGTTRMFRSEPAGVMEQESSYFALLSSVDGYAVSAETLTLYTQGDAVLRFELAGGVTPAQ